MKNGEMAVKRKAKRPGQQKGKQTVQCREGSRRKDRRRNRRKNRCSRRKNSAYGSREESPCMRIIAQRPVWRASPARTAERRFIRMGPAPTIEIIARIVSTVFMWMKSPGTGRLPVTGKWSRLRSFPERTETGAFFTAACVAEN